MSDLLRILRARWVVVVLAVVVALATGWLTVSLTDVDARRTRSHSATTVLLSSVPSTTSGVPRLGLATIAALVKIDDVAQRVADTLAYDGDPSTLSAQIDAEADEQAGILNITATAGTGPEAKALADAYADELIGYIEERRSETVEQQLEDLDAQIRDVNQQIADLEQQVAENPDQADLIDTQRAVQINTLNNLEQQRRDAEAAASEPLGIEIVQKAIPVLAANEVFQPPRSRLALALIAGILGLLAGIGVALVLERLRAPIRTKSEAEAHFGAPVLAEIPNLNRRERESIVSVINPRSPAAEAFRLLEAGMDRSSTWNGKGSADSGRRARTHPSRVIAVTSSSPGEGKTTIVANLATAYAERGKRVVILSCDFRHPRIHRLLDAPNEPGLSEALRSADVETAVRDYAVTTFLPGVSMSPSGAVTDNPGELLGSPGMRRVLASVRRDADVVLIDTAPILWAADAAHLVPEVDSVLLVARSGETRVDVAKRTAELMTLLKVPVIGVVLNATTHGSFQRRYYEGEVALEGQIADDDASDSESSTASAGSR